MRATKSKVVSDKKLNKVEKSEKLNKFEKSNTPENRECDRTDTPL